MADYRQYLDPRTLAKLQGLHVRARRIVEGYVSGMHASPLHGFSIEFAEHREYSPGDDLRYVDWKVYGRSDKFYLKQYEEETNLVCYLLVDVSESMQYQSDDAPLSKAAYAQAVAAALAYLVVRQQDSVGLVTFDDEIRGQLRPAGGGQHWKHLVDVLEQPGGGRKTATGPILHDLAQRWRKRGLVILLGDLFDDVGALLAGLRHLRHRRHDVIVMQVLDPAELDFPFRRTTLFDGLEQWGQVVTDPRALRTAYLAEFQRFLRAVQRGCREHRVDYVRLRTDQPVGVALATYLAARTSRVRAGRT